MKVLLRRNVRKLGIIGEVVDVKPGYARNYLLPEGLAVAPSAANLKSVENEKAAYLAELATVKAELRARAQLLTGKEFTLTARANEEGNLYGSIGPAQIASALAAEQVFIEAEYVVIDEPIRRLDKYDLTIRFAEDVTATIHLWVVPVHEGEGEDQSAPPEASDPATQPSDATEDAPGDQDRR